MNLKEREQAAEQWLDESLAALRATEPRQGLEMRVVAGVHAFAERRRRRWTFVVAASAAAVLITAVVITWPRAKSRLAPEVGQQEPAVQPNVASAPAPTTIDRSSNLGSRKAARLPREIEVARVNRTPVLKRAFESREATFPSAATPNEQGRLLQAFLRQTPPQDLALIAARQPSLSSLESEDLKISPLQVSDLTPKAEATKDRDQN